MENGTTDKQRLAMALFLAAAVHALVILGLGIEPPRSAQPSAGAMEVTLAPDASPQPVDSARFIAESDQSGRKEAEPGTPAARPSPTTSASPSGQADQRKARQQARSADVLHVRLRSAATAASSDPVTDPASRQATSRPEIAGGEGAVQARAAREAAYLREWVSQVEKLGNAHYPPAARERNLGGRLTLEVIIDARGGVQSVRLLESSGVDVLDEAARRTVMLGAPYPPFPPELRKTHETLRIVRSWEFQPGSSDFQAR